MSTLSEHLIEEIRELPAKYPQPRSAVMPALDLAQEEVGYLTPEAMSEVADALKLDPGYVEGVATFYTLFHLQPIGKQGRALFVRGGRVPGRVRVRAGDAARPPLREGPD